MSLTTDIKTDLRRAKIFAGHKVAHTKERQSGVNVNTVASTSTQRLLRLFLPWFGSPTGAGPPHYRDFAIILGTSPLNEGLASHIDISENTNTHSTHPCPRDDSNLQSQQANGRRSML